MNDKGQLYVLDCFAGAGFAMQAFVDRGHIVHTVDIKGSQTYVMDIRRFHPCKGIHYDFIWMSLPCTRLGENLKEQNDISIITACFRIIAEALPKFWMIADFRDCLQQFMGKPDRTILYSGYDGYTKNPTNLWGCFPKAFSEILKSTELTTIDRLLSMKYLPWCDIIPYGLSYAICKAVEDDIGGVLIRNE